jgi:uncharacterized membrane protein YhaH (DUF805 family)
MSSYATGARGRSLPEAVDICLKNYVGFEGRAPRSEYWYWALAVFLLMFALDFIFILLGLALHIKWLTTLVGLVVELAALLPSIAVAVRRLHDRDRSGWWYLIIFVPLVGGIIMLVWMCLPGTAGTNRFGPDPLGGTQW